MRIVFVQPTGMGDPGGSSKIFRTLLERYTGDAASMVFSCVPPTRASPIEEIHVREGPFWRKLRQSRFSTLPKLCRGIFWDKAYREAFGFLEGFKPQVVHALAHDFGFWPAFEFSRQHSLPYILSVHDDIRHLLSGDFWLARAERWLGTAWQSATYRLVISPEIGEEYCRRYGQRPWIPVTDGLEHDAIASDPRTATANRLTLYFAGGLNVPYEPNLLSLQQALKALERDPEIDQAGLILRGGRRLSGEDPDAPPFEVRPYAPQAEVLRDLNEVDVLYLPLSIDPKYANFAKFSLSTKMITYLGSGLPIFYHGPEDSAAYRLLKRNDACVACFSNDPREIAAVLKSIPQHRERIVLNALNLARREFIIDDIRERFWSRINEAVVQQSSQ